MRQCESAKRTVRAVKMHDASSVDGFERKMFNYLSSVALWPIWCTAESALMSYAKVRSSEQTQNRDETLPV